VNLRLVDLSVPIQEPVAGELHGGMGAILAAEIEYESHTDTHRELAAMFGFQVEELRNLGALPERGFRVPCLPVKIARGSAGWCRAVAIFGFEG
jgi:kynurenine formamidase